MVKIFRHSMGITNCKGYICEDRCCNRMSWEKELLSMCLEVVCPGVGNWRGAVDGIGFEHSWICWSNDEKLEEESLFRTGTSCSGIPHYMELLIRLASFFQQKEPTDVEKEKRKDPPFFTSGSTSLNANGKDAAIQWDITNCKGGYIVSEDLCCNRMSLEKRVSSMLRNCLPSSGNWRGAVDGIGFEHCWICQRNEEHSSPRARCCALLTLSTHVCHAVKEGSVTKDHVPRETWALIERQSSD
ncbi:hypothetical protein CEXT_641611 [Caerostris extrusa]|uniref:Uncharacterized protein n=1 Tax=Caerostris extrusa TaxID=172846 RepID=A0AAV4VRI1_CAEEX|nr:hypothetical protein CEXT_641611 [Caerostris extrusa]